MAIRAIEISERMKCTFCVLLLSLSTNRIDEVEKRWKRKQIWGGHFM